MSYLDSYQKFKFKTYFLSHKFFKVCSNEKIKIYLFSCVLYSTTFLNKSSLLNRKYMNI